MESSGIGAHTPHARFDERERESERERDRERVGERERKRRESERDKGGGGALPDRDGVLSSLESLQGYLAHFL